MDKEAKDLREELRGLIDRANQVLSAQQEQLDDQRDDIRKSREFNDKVLRFLEKTERLDTPEV